MRRLVHRTVKRHPPASVHRALRESRGQDEEAGEGRGGLTGPIERSLDGQFLYYWLVGAGFTQIQAHPLPVRRLERLALLRWRPSSPPWGGPPGARVPIGIAWNS